ncbi:transcriptional activator FtrB [Stieleria bergensis]|uniref:Transcriptional activator FtrB n=2 Tax=Stieleria bergensis TaxID=2528025 RepID=A0A517SZ72_9BACT|nr:transcriptional activator FtrB [Planctomycetes bacterium SV_7m_r]
MHICTESWATECSECDVYPMVQQLRLSSVMFLRIPFERQLSENDRASLVELADCVTVETGQIIFREGERHPFVYWIVEGQVSLEMASGEKTMQPLVTLADGDLLAWSSLLTDRRMTATAKTISPTRLMRFGTESLLDLCEANHEIGYRVMQHIAGQLAQRLLATRLQMLDLFQHPAELSSESKS